MNDIAFHFLFGTEERKHNLIHFLNSVLCKWQEPIFDLTLQETRLDPEVIGLKSCRLDVRAVTTSGTQLNIEVQINNQINMEKRSLFYWSKLYVSQLKEAIDYRNLAKTIAINILDFNYLDNNKVHSVYRITEVETGNLLSNNLEIHFFELPRLGKSEDMDLACPQTRWLLFLKDDIDQRLRRRF